MKVHLQARVVDKPWGHEEIFAQTPDYVGKILFIRQGEALSLQYHEVKEETLRVLDGELELVLGTRYRQSRNSSPREGSGFPRVAGDASPNDRGVGLQPSRGFDQSSR